MIPGIIGSGGTLDPVKIKKIWDGFTVKDLTLEEFTKELEDLTNPIKLGNDLNAELSRRRGI